MTTYRAETPADSTAGVSARRGRGRPDADTWVGMALLWAGPALALLLAVCWGWIT
jgi:hypothetical protein